MDKKYAPYIRYGHKVNSAYTAEEYKVIEDLGAEGKDIVRCVALSAWDRYRLLKAWIHNRVGSAEENEKEMESYEVELNVADIVPSNRIRILGPDFNTLFEVENLHNISVNGKVEKAYYIDECHFGFVGGTVYHTHEFAELCKKHRTVVALASV